jgi:4-hydroxy-tetrahydrodipicolinate synthase
MFSFKEIHGVLPVLHTPFNMLDEIDESILVREVEWVIAQGADGVATGMVSELLRISPSERMRLHEVVCNAGINLGCLIVLSTGSESSKQSIEYTKHAESLGADAVMVNPPFTTALDDDALYSHYAMILDSTNIPLIVQDASGYIGKALSLEIQIKLLNNYGKRVYFKPEAVPIGQRLSTFMALTEGKARVFEGSGGAALVDTYSRGVVGTMPGADTTWSIVALWNALKRDDLELVNAISGPLANLINLEYSIDSYIAIEKYLLRKQGIFVNELVREPVGYRLDNKTREHVDRIFQDLFRTVHKTNFASIA